MHTRLIARLLQATLACLFTAAIALPAAAAELGAQKSSAGGVIIAVTPQNVSGDVKTWDFKVVFDTHSGSLDDDLTKSAVLVDGSGGRYTPVAWDGAGPGGHHREGTLKFNAISPRPASVELQIARSGEAAPRAFRWQLK